MAPVAILAPNGLAVLLALTGIGLIACEPRRLALAHVPLVPKAALGALFAFAALSSVWAPNIDEALSGLQRVLPAAFLGLVAVDKALDASAELRARVAHWLLLGFVAAIAVLAAEIASQIVFGFQNSLFAQLFGPMGASQAFTNRPKTVLAVLLPLAASAAWIRYGWKAALGLAGACVPLLTFGEAMGAAMALPVALVGAAFGWFSGRNAGRTVAAASVAAILLAPAIAQSPPLESLALRRDISVSIYHRAAIWDFVGDRIAEKPVLGWGMNASRNIPNAHETIPGGVERIPLHPHNFSLQLWLELGGVGAALASLALGFLGLGCAGSRMRQAALVATLATALFVASVGYGMWQGWWFATLWLLCAFACTIGRESLGTKPAS